MRYFRSKLKEKVHARYGKAIPTHEEIAGVTGIRRGTVGQWMSDRLFRRLDMDILEPMAEWLECDTEDLYEVVETDTPEYSAAPTFA
jgi:transcriptional regulator with XRE-family HTH domain